MQSVDAEKLKNGLDAIANAYGLDAETVGKLLSGVSKGKEVVEDIQQPKLHLDKPCPPLTFLL